MDSGFGIGGKVTTDFGSNGDAAYGVAEQSDGRIVVAGTTNPFTGDFALARYNPDGSPDAGFGTGGKVVTDFGPGRAVATVVALQGNKIVLAGFAGTPSGPPAGLDLPWPATTPARSPTRRRRSRA